MCEACLTMPGFPARRCTHILCGTWNPRARMGRMHAQGKDMVALLTEPPSATLHSCFLLRIAGAGERALAGHYKALACRSALQHSLLILPGGSAGAGERALALHALQSVRPQERTGLWSRFSTSC